MTHPLKGRKQSPAHIESRIKASWEARKRNGTKVIRGPVSEETKRKISEARKGQPSMFKGRTHSAESRQKISQNNRRVFEERHAALIAKFPDMDIHQLVRLIVRKKQNASRRNKAWKLTDIEAAQLLCSPCTYCGEPSTGIDRIDSDGDYTVNNTVASCYTCNVVKGTMTVSEFKAHIHKWAAKHFV